MDDGARAHNAAALSPDVLLSVFRFLAVPELVEASAVCKHWRHTTDSSSALWANLDLGYAEHHAFSPSMLGPLLLRSRKAPLLLRLKTNSYDILWMQTVCSLLEPHLDRLRLLTVRARSCYQYRALFSLFEKPLPALRYVDISYSDDFYPILGGQGTPPDGLFVVAPQLCSADWDEHRLPKVLNRLSDVTYLRLSYADELDDNIFYLFPRLTELCLENVSVVEDMQILPPTHPLQSLEFHLAPGGDLGSEDLWALLKVLGFCRIAELELHDFPARVLVSAARDSDWHVSSLAISYTSAYATLVSHESSECRMFDLTGDSNRPTFSESPASAVQCLMDDRAWARTLTALTLSAVHFAREENTWLPLPWGAAPALVELSLVYGTPHAGAWVSLLDPHVASRFGVLDAPLLRVLRLVPRTETSDENVVQPAALARFILAHVRVGGGPVPLLRISWFLRFSEDRTGMDTLRAVVDEIEDTL